MRGGKIVILVFLAPDESKSSQRIGMLDTRHENPWEQGAGRGVMKITQPQMIPGYHTGFLCWETDKDIWKWVRSKGKGIVKHNEVKNVSVVIKLEELK